MNFSKINLSKWKLSLAVSLVVCVCVFVGTYYYVRSSIQQSQSQLVEAQQKLLQKSQALVEMIPQFMKVLSAASLKANEQRRLRSAEHFYQRAQLVTGTAESYNRSERELIRATEIIQELIQLGKNNKDLKNNKTFLDLESVYRQQTQESFELRTEIYVKDSTHKRKLAALPEKWVASLSDLRAGPPVRMPRRL